MDNNNTSGTGNSTSTSTPPNSPRIGTRTLKLLALVFVCVSLGFVLGWLSSHVFTLSAAPAPTAQEIAALVPGVSQDVVQDAVATALDRYVPAEASNQDNDLGFTRLCPRTGGKKIKSPFLWALSDNDVQTAVCTLDKGTGCLVCKRLHNPSLCENCGDKVDDTVDTMCQSVVEDELPKECEGYEPVD